MISSGPSPARIMIVGEAPGQDEIFEGRPFVGVSGRELSRMLSEVGIDRSRCFICNVVDERPQDNDIENFFLTKTAAAGLGLGPVMGRYPNSTVRAGLDTLARTIAAVRPELIIALGNTALWALTGNSGILKWRGSQLTHSSGATVIPAVHPAAILREWSLRAVAVQDLRRAARVSAEGNNPPAWNFLLRPTFSQAMDYLESLRAYPSLVCDIETRARQIACVGIAPDKNNAICIPFMSVTGHEGSYWSEAEEIAVATKMRSVLASAPVTFQNGAYDLQYFAMQWGYLPTVTDDTMLMQHVLYPGMKKSLDFISSMYCEHYSYWKDDGKNWDPHMGEEQLWHYNCQDCVRTYECRDVLDGLIESSRMVEQYHFQMDTFHIAVEMMLRGLRTDAKRQRQVCDELTAAIDRTQRWIDKAVGYPLNVGSPKQMAHLFWDDFGCQKVISRKTGTPTLNSEALHTITRRQPILRPLTEKIEELRSYRVFKSTFAEARVGTDGRMRCSFNLAGTETFRWSASEDAFGSGCNLQTLPKGNEDD